MIVEKTADNVRTQDAGMVAEEMMYDADIAASKPEPPELMAQNLVRTFSADVFRVAFAGCGSRAQAEDIMQDVFLRLVRTRPSFQNEEHAKAWLLRVTMNCCSSAGRSFWKRQVSSLDEMLERRGDGAGFEAGKAAERVHTGTGSSAAALHDPEAALEATDRHESVLGAVMALAPKQRVCVHLFYYEQQSIAEIAQVCGWPASTVKSHLRRGRTALRLALSEEYEI